MLEGGWPRPSGYGLTVRSVCIARVFARFAQSGVHWSIAVSGTPCGSTSLFRWHSECYCQVAAAHFSCSACLRFRQGIVWHPASTNLATGAAARPDAQLVKLIRFVPRKITPHASLVSQAWSATNLSVYLHTGVGNCRSEDSLAFFARYSD